MRGGAMVIMAMATELTFHNSFQTLNFKKWSLFSAFYLLIYMCEENIINIR